LNQKIIFCICAGILFNTGVEARASLDYRQIFQEKYAQAMERLEETRFYFKKSALSQEEQKILIPVIFPELLRYSKFQDSFEVQALELMYIPGGIKKADYSIGLFQMKPSFVESLERWVFRFPQLSFFREILRFRAANPAAVKKERLRRLQSIAWQIKYLRCFYAILKLRFPFLQETSVQEIILFVSSAYNTGFENKQEKIKANLGLKRFPHGPSYRGTQYNYSDVAWYFYETNWKKHYQKWF